MRNLIIQMSAYLLFTILSISCVAQRLENRPVIKSESYNFVVNADIKAALKAKRSTNSISGRLSLNFKALEEDLEKGIIRVKGLNFAFFRVDQQQFAEKKELKKDLGLLGISVDRRKQQLLKINKKRNRIEGTLNMVIDAAVLSTLRIKENTGPNDDEFPATVVPAICKIIIELEEPIPSSKNGYHGIKGKMKVFIQSKEYDLEEFLFPPIEIELNQTQILFEFVYLPSPMEATQNLCIQPVFLVRINFNTNAFGMPFFTIETTGDGLNFGKPELKKQWRKIDVTFNIREPIFKFNDDFFEFSESEEQDLLNLVDEDDCIEVFFVDKFTPTVLWGGGATIGSGVGTAKIISSDENADSAIDLTHLAHEFGHVLGLRHPGDLPTSTAVPGTSGTLICPSGFMIDNPKINSYAHRDLISNSLLKYSLDPLSSHSPDCINSSDCGVCPP